MPSSSRESTPALHFILRYSDMLRGVDTYAEHKAIEQREGAVWWGKFGVGASLAIIAKAKQQLEDAIPTFVYLALNRNLAYRGQLVDIIGGGVQSKYRPKDRNRIPGYYRGESCAVWFKLKDLAPATPQDKKRLVLFHQPAAKPQLSGMKGLIYVSHGTPRAGAARTGNLPDDWPERDY